MLVALRPPVRLEQPKTPKQTSTEGIFSFLAKRFTPRTVFMEIGGADCTLALRAAGYVERVYAIGLSGQFLENLLLPCNLRLVMCDGVRIPVPEGSVELAWGGAFMDRLHADDVREHLKNVHRSLLPGGQYFFTSSSPETLRLRLFEAGYTSVSCWLGAARLPWVARSLVPRNLLRLSATR
jgi:hypothetical protein